MKSAFQRFLLPGLVFQSINIAGGYGTGRELVEFFLQYGPVGGLLGLLFPATIIVSVACIIAFELARQTRSYDYRRFLQQLLGRAWFLYEITYLISVILILAVVGAAIGSIATESLNIPGYVGTLVLLATIAFLTFRGTRLIERVMSAWSLVLYVVYASIFVVSMIRFGPMVRDAFAADGGVDGWLLSGLRYGALQLAMVPAILFATTHINSRKDAVVAGALAGPLFLLPAIMFFLAMAPHYPSILSRPVPLNYILSLLNSPILSVAFPVMLVGTFIETGTGMIHAFNERVAGALKVIGRDMPRSWRSITAVLLLVGAMLMSRLGIIDLIAVGYGALTWVYMVIFVVPLLTLGLWKITRRSG